MHFDEFMLKHNYERLEVQITYKEDMLLFSTVQVLQCPIHLLVKN